MISCVRRIQFCSGHRVYLHESKCKHPHGHNYVAFFHATAPELDAIGRVIDFSILKARLGGWIDTHWDHGFIYFKGDKAMADIFGCGSTYKSYELPLNPTAENMAKYLLDHVCPGMLFDTGIEIEKVVIWETENCYAEATV